MATLRGRVFDGATGRALEARVQVLDATGHPRAPDGAILKKGPGEPFFYCEGAFEVDVPRGQVDVIVERGTEYRPLRLPVDAGAAGGIDVELPLERWVRMAERGLHAGNTHVHYDEKETRPLERLRLDPRVEDLPVLVVSRLIRRELPYASNAFPIGRHELSGHGHVIDVGEESRHNDEPWRIGLGHIMLINIERQVDPVSRGILVDDSAPDYPPLVDACDAARAQGGLVLWCHNANGMEAPVAAALGKLDGLNLFDPYWMDPEYDLWYALLDCGIRLPASTGSDWFVCSSNRVYVQTEPFTYEGWLDGLRQGRTFVTNGPVLSLRVEGRPPSSEPLGLAGDRRVEVAVEYESAEGIDRVELVRDGEVVLTAPPAAERARPGHVTTKGELRTRVDAAGAGWLAARCWGRRRNSYGHPLWAHTSPVYLRDTPAPARARAAAALFLARLDRAAEWLASRARFDDVAQRQRMLQLFAEGRRLYERLERS
jgi:hypothetical protein